jgi:acyl-coenzyme A thioesterase 9
MLPFQSDPKLRELYLNASGHLRIGRLLEDFDSFAGQIAYTHCDNQLDTDSEPLTLVTASLDRIDLLQEIPTDRDLQLRGCVTWVGKSSMAIVVTLSVLPDGITAQEAMAIATDNHTGMPKFQAPASDRPEDASEAQLAVKALADAAAVGGSHVDPVVRAEFTFVARNMADSAVVVPRLKTATDAEASLFRASEEGQLARRAARSRNLDHAPPTPEELGIVHRIFADLRTLRKQRSAAATAAAPESATEAAVPPGSGTCDASVPALVADTALESIVVTFPTDRNIHGKVFGGWLLRNAFELAWATALKFGGAAPSFVAMSDIAFLRPVEIGAVLCFKAKVEYSEGGAHRTASVCVETTSTNPAHPHAGAPTTNTFHFTFEFPETGSGRPVPRAFPESYEEAMDWVAAHRRRQQGMQLRSQWAMHGELPRV